MPHQEKPGGRHATEPPAQDIQPQKSIEGAASPLADAAGEGAPATAGTAKAGAAKAGAAKAGAAKAGAAKAGAAKAGAAKAGAAKAGAAKTGAAKTGAAKTGDAKTGDAKAGAAKTGDAKAGAAKTGVAKTGDAKAGAAKTGVAKTGAAKTTRSVDNRAPGRAGADAEAGDIDSTTQRPGPARRKATTPKKATAPDSPKAQAPKRKAATRVKPAVVDETPEDEDIEYVEAEPEEADDLIPGLLVEEDVSDAEWVESAEEHRRAPLVPLPIDNDELDEPEPSSTALSRTDPLARYMQEVSRYPLLSREDEHELAVHYQKTGDLDAAARLVASNLRLVVKIAYEYRRAAFNVLDLIQEGNVGLMHAVKKYDPFKGVKLSSYAAWWIRAYILRFVMDNWRMVKLGTTQAQRRLFFNLRKEQRKLALEGYDPGSRLLAERLNVTEREVEEMDSRLGGDEFSIDTPVGGEEGSATWGDRLSLPSPAADEQLGQEQLKELLRVELAAFAETLEDRDLYIFQHRMIADDPMTLQEIGNHFGFSRERARQIEARLISRLRERMQDRMPDFDALTPEEE